MDKTRFMNAVAGAFLLQIKASCSATVQSEATVEGLANRLWTWVVEALERPSVYYPVIVWAIVFTLTSTLLLTLGFGPAGVIAGSIAAAFQSWMYGGFTPAAGVFATLTSLGMLGFANPVCGLISGVTATLAAGLTWVLLGGPG